MSKTPIRWLSTILMTMACATSLAEQQTEASTEKFIGKWDRTAGIISLFIHDSAGVKRARLLVADERIENNSSKLSFDMSSLDLDELEDLIEDTLKELGTPENLPIPPLNAKEAVNHVGQLSYPNGKLLLTIVDPPGARRYVTLLIYPLNRKFQFIYWMDREDLVALKKLLDRGLNELGEL